MPQTVRLLGPTQRALAHRLIDAAPERTVVEFKPEGRTLDQNAKLHAMLSDIARARPEGRCHTPEVWKALAMHACGHAVQFVNGLDGLPFPIGFRSSRLSKAQMSELIEFLYEFGARHGVPWSEPQPKEIPCPS